MQRNKVELSSRARFARGIAQGALLIAIAFSAAACKTTAKHDAHMQSEIPTDYRLRHPITIQERDASLEIFVGERRGGLTGEQRAAVYRFTDVWRKEATGGILIDVPKGTPNAAAAAETARHTRSMLVQSGVPARAVAVRHYHPKDPEQLATVRLRYPRMAAQAGPCGLWPEDLGLTHNAQPTMNRPYWNHGCASQRNLAAMVDNPSDLVQPRQETPVWAPRRRTGIELYRTGQASSVRFEGLSGGGK